MSAWTWVLRFYLHIGNRLQVCWWVEITASKRGITNNAKILELSIERMTLTLTEKGKSLRGSGWQLGEWRPWLCTWYTRGALIMTKIDTPKQLNSFAIKPAWKHTDNSDAEHSNPPNLWKQTKCDSSRRWKWFGEMCAVPPPALRAVLLVGPRLLLQRLQRGCAPSPVQRVHFPGRSSMFHLRGKWSFHFWRSFWMLKLQCASKYKSK